MAQMAAVSAAIPTGAAAGENQDIDDFIYLISHDVRASVRALLELPKWIEEDLQDAGVDLNGSVGQSIEMMNRHTARLDRMLLDLLSYSRIGRMQKVESVDIAQSIDEVLSGLHLPEKMQLKRQIVCSHAMIGERDMLLMLSALIGNAVKHNTKGAGDIMIRTEREGETFRLTICDEGPGIPARFHAKAMGAMTTLRSRDEVEGTGMGLANVRKIAAHYGGHMDLSETHQGGGGLRVDVVLPRAE